MRAAADQVDAVKILKPVVRPQMEHLPQIMRHAESGSLVQPVVRAPIGRRDHFLETNAAFHVRNANLFQLPQSQGPEARFLLIPVDIAMLVRHRQQDVERAHLLRRQRGVGDAGILHIERRILRELVQLFNIAQVLAVILGQVNGVVRYIIKTSFNAQIEHEGGAGEALLLNFAIGPAPSNRVRHHALHRQREVRVDDNGIGGQSAVGGAHRGAFTAGKDHLLDRFVQQHADTQFLRDAGHGFRDRAATPYRMKDAMLILEKRENAE